MPHHTTRTASLILSAAMAASAFPSPGAAAPRTPPTPAPAIVDVLVDGAARPQYPARGTRYVEAVRGRDYEIRLRNPYPVRVAVALSVDGLNTIDARRTSAPEARKWVLEAYEEVTIRGWQVSAATARRFTFTTEERSYAQRLGQSANLGVISAVFFRERQDRAWPTAAADVAAPAAPAPAVPVGEHRAAESQASARARDAYAATGQGARTEHRVQQVHIDLEDRPAVSIDLRYEYRDQLVRLGVLPPLPVSPLDRRERARGFERGFCPEIF